MKAGFSPIGRRKGLILIPEATILTTVIRWKRRVRSAQRQLGVKND